MNGAFPGCRETGEIPFFHKKNEQNLVVADPRFKEIGEGFSALQLGQASVPNH